MRTYSRFLFLLLGLVLCYRTVFAQEKSADHRYLQVDSLVRQIMKDGNIPGLSLVLIDGKQSVFRNYGVADLRTGQKVTDSTLFELGSCSKAFTALAVLRLMQQKGLSPDAPVSDYIPWFRVSYKGKPAVITIRQLLHHTSGIPWKTISYIPISDKDDALEKTVRTLVGQKLENKPGYRFEYATINYDVLALFIQYVSGQSFEEYVKENVFQTLDLRSTSFNQPVRPETMAAGYKIGFNAPRKFDAPRYRGNNAAGYILSDATDMEHWVRFQLEGTDSSLVQQTQQRDETVPLHDMSSYAMGWEVSLSGDGNIYHGGVNPNYSSYVILQRSKQQAMILLANSNSGYVPLLANSVMKIMAGEELPKQIRVDDRSDKAYAVIAIILCFYILCVAALMVLMVVDISRGKRQYTPLNAAGIRKFLMSVLLVLPFLAGLYLFPETLAGVNWEFALVWSPSSFDVLIRLLLLAILVSYAGSIASMFFPARERLRQIAPQILLMSTLSGIANMILILLVTSSINSNIELKYLIFYYTITLALYILGRKFVQLNMTKITRDAVFDIRMELFEKIFSTSYQKFEKINRGRIYTVLNEDVATVAESANMFIMLVTSIFTALCAFLYLATIALWATVLTVVLILVLGTIFYFVSERTNPYFEAARDTRDVFMRLTNGMIDGFKEISLHRNKKLEYKADVEQAARNYKDKTFTANVRFLYAFLIGETLLILLLGAVSFVLPKMFEDIQRGTIMSFVIVLLYLIGPITRILGAVPAVMQLRIAWNRIRKFLNDIPSNLNLREPPVLWDKKVQHLSTKDIMFSYYENGKSVFTVGPIDIEASSGEILFIIGGNGSGKTTFVKLISGLYEPEEGEIRINGKVITGAQLSEYFSAVFNPIHLFDKIYNASENADRSMLQEYLQLLDLDKKVVVNDSVYSTINLSGGQRKRLALLQCYLEDSPIYLFDEWAADQDPGYRSFFYRKLLPDMKALGKIVIAVTHDDHYFDVADRILKMSEGKIEIETSVYAVKETISFNKI